MRIISYIVIILIFSFSAQAQELNTKLTINTQRLPSADRGLFTSLESSLNQMLNEQQWTDVAFKKDERIDCTLTLIIAEKADNTYKAELQVASRRPVYNSSYITTMLNFRDTEFYFNYIQGQSLNFNTLQVTDNLIAVISYYAYIVIGLDFDSFSMNGGKPYFTKAMDIANMAQTFSNTKGWEPFSGKDSNRYDLALALTEESSASFHSMWYNYHRLGLDEMAANPSRGRIRVMESINDIKKLHESRPNSPLITLISNTKVDEILRICSNATDEEKKEMRETLSSIFPTKSALIKTLK